MDKIRISDQQALELVTNLALLLDQPVTVVLNSKIKDQPLKEWLKRKNFNVGAIERLAQHHLYDLSW